MSGSIAALFQRLTQGVYVVGVGHREARNAFTAAWVTQVSFDPSLLALSINPHHSSYGLLKLNNLDIGHINQLRVRNVVPPSAKGHLLKGSRRAERVRSSSDN
jgi:flavin reductase (DIM6/NTAB) family NADH-FMN oxidoreductase RutF